MIARRLFVFFFFSSRRRHTRCGRDWSSDVCSSDLIERRQTWKRASARDRSLRLASETARRVNHFPVGRFPFDLPAHSEKYGRRKKPTAVQFDAPQHVEISSPSGALKLIWDYQDPAVNRLRVVTRDGLTNRALSLPPSTVHHVRQTFLSGIDSLGWQ